MDNSTVLPPYMIYRTNQVQRVEAAIIQIQRELLIGLMVDLTPVQRLNRYKRCQALLIEIYQVLEIGFHHLG